MWRVSAAVIVAALMAGGPGGARPARVPQVVVIMVPDSDWAVAPRGLESWSKANVAFDTAFDTRREIDVYLTLGKARRSAGVGEAYGVGPVTVTGRRLAIQEWATLERHDRGLRYGGRLGRLGQLLKDGRVPTAVVAPNHDLAGAFADESGVVDDFRAGGTAEAAGAVAEGIALVAVETPLDSVIATVDGTATASSPGARPCQIVVSASAPADGQHLGLLAASPQCGLGRGQLDSSSTRQPGLVTMPDVTATVLSVTGVAVPSGMGTVVRPSGQTTVARLIDLEHRSRVAGSAEKPFVFVFIAAALAGVATVRRRQRVRVAVAAFALALPTATLLIMVFPWWRHGVAGGVVALVVVSAVIAAGALVLVRGRSGLLVGALGVTTVAVVGLDAVRRGSLQFDAPMMNNAIFAGRFTGLGNVPYGFLVGAAIVTAGLALERWGSGARARWIVISALAAVVIVDGAPVFGADAGGVLGAVPAFGVLVLIARGRSSWRAIARLGAAALATLVALALFDTIRPPSERTHLARALTSGDAIQTIVRRFLAAVGSFRFSPWVAVAVLAVAVILVGRRRLPAAPAARAGLVALSVAAILGAILNDSGVAVTGAVLAVGWPASLALTSDAAEVGAPEGVTRS